MLPTHWCDKCQRAFIHNVDGKIACPKCGEPPVARGVPAVGEFTRGERRVTR